MPRKPIVSLFLLVAIPLTAFAWLGWHAARGEQARVEQAYRRLMAARLTQENKKLADYFDRQQRKLARETRACRDDATRIRKLVQTAPLVRQVIVLDAEGRVIHPAPQEPASRSERAFLSELQPILDDKDVTRAAFGASIRTSGKSANMNIKLGSRYTKASGKAAPTSFQSEGWHVWYYGRGANLLYWHRWSDTRVTIVGLARARLISDLLSVLPETVLQAPAEVQSANGLGTTLLDTSHPAQWNDEALICLVDSADQVVYQWGHGQRKPGVLPHAELAVAPPLTAWRLKYYAMNASPNYSQLPVLAGMGSLAVAMLAVAFILYRDYTRDLREARQRVNFVNQVSHELKTPLTNIRMYADLLEFDLASVPDQAAKKPRSRVAIIVAESLRLSRLINNVLSFARSQRNQLTLRPRTIDLDATIREIAEHFEPSLAAVGIALDLNLNVSEPVVIDPDVVQQVVGNLISNAQNYAADGGYLGVVTQMDSESERVSITVTDRGPGIAEAIQRRLFEPFVRAADKLNDVNGTGIGLSISRRLARAHGGDLRWLPTERGACFRVTLKQSTSTVKTPTHRESVTK